MSISFGVLRSPTILIAALLIAATAYAQSDTNAASGKSCADVKPPVVNPANMIDNIPIYLIPPGAMGHQAICRATEALAEGMVAAEFSDDVILANALGDPEADTTKGKVSEFPYSAPGSTPSPGFPPPGPSPERVEDSHLYAAFIDPNTGVEYTFSSVADSLTDFEAAASEWLTSTVEPLLEQNASGARTLAAPNLRVHAASNAKLAAVSDAAISAPPYDPLAWDLLVDSTSVMPNVKLARGTVAGKDTELGKSSVLLRIYRLNAGAGANDYYLVDAKYTQTPTYSPFSAFPSLVKAWANQRTKFELKARYPRGTFGPLPTLLEFAPRTAISGKSETYTVGADLTASSASVSGSYSVTTTQDSVDTSANATLGEGLLRWNDTYYGFPSDNPPSTSIQTFTGERLAIFTVSRTINDNVPAGKSAGLEFHFSLASDVQAEVELLFIKSGYYAAWGSSGDLFAAEPQFSVSTRNVTVSRSKNNINNPVRVKVLAELPDGGHKVVWKATNRLTSIAADADVGKGNGEIDIYPTNSMDNGETGGSILVDSSPSGGADSLRNGPIRITVTVEP